jgi:DHA2 family methylenomycin A resistance protein-like MFS transporter
MLPLSFFKRNQFTIAVCIGLVLNFGIYGELFALPLYFQHVRGYGIAETGFALLPLVILIALGSYLSGKLISSKGIKLPLILGLSVGALGFFGLLIAQAETPNYFWLIFPLAAMGFGISFCQPAATIAAISALPKEKAGLAAAVFTTSRQIGSLVGVALFGSIITAAASFTFGFHITLIISGLAYLGALMLALILQPNN